MVHVALCIFNHYLLNDANAKALRNAYSPWPYATHFVSVEKCFPWHLKIVSSSYATIVLPFCTLSVEIDKYE